jgi:multicomponent Na+:H+ antiporter subunit D
LIAALSVAAQALASRTQAGLCLLVTALAGGAALLGATPVAGFAFLEAAALCLAALAIATAQSRAERDRAGGALIAFGLGAMLFAAGIGFSGGPMAQAFGLALMTAGALIKAGVAPFHGGFAAVLGDRLSGAPALAALSLALSAMAILMRLIDAAPSPALQAGLALALAALGGFGAVYAALLAAGAANVRAFVGLSIAAQLGCVLIGFAADPAAGLAQAAALIAMACGLCAAIDAIGLNGQERLEGLGRRAPLAAAALSVAGLSISGAPLTAGFLGKWLLIEAVLEQGWWLAAAAVVASGLLAIAAVGSLIERLYFTAPLPADPPTVLPAPQLGRLLALAASIAITIGLGLNAAGWIAWARYAASGFGLEAAP